MTFNTEAEAIEHMEKFGCDYFEGMNCEDECTGWDGESRRCECGNRRVQLLTSQDQEGKWFAYGEAY